MTMRSKPGPPMTLANMRQNGVRMVTATCEACGREADVNVDALSESVHVPDAGKRLRCSNYDGKRDGNRMIYVYDVTLDSIDTPKLQAIVTKNFCAEKDGVSATT